MRTPISDGEFLEGMMISLAMWADENGFGHGLADDPYEDECERFADDAHALIAQTLTDRPVR